MPIISPSNIEYLGSKPNFTRDTYDTLEAMQTALEAGHIDEGHLSYCRETGITYRAIKEGSGLVWEDTIGGLREGLTERILDSERAASESIQELNTGMQSLQENLEGQIQSGQAETAESIQNLDLKIEDLRGDLIDQIQDSGRVTSEALSELTTRLSRVESEIINDESGGLGPDTRLDQVYSWFDEQTHIPVLASQIVKSSSGNLRQGTSHTYTANFTWDWANREPGVTGLSITNNGITATKTFTEISKDPSILGGSYSWSIPVTLGNSSITLKASFYNTNTQGTSSLTIQPLTPTYTWNITGLPGTWESYNLGRTYTLSMTVTGKDLAVSQEGDRIYKSDGSTLKVVRGITDSNIVATETKSIIPTNIGQLSWYWKSGPVEYLKGSYVTTEDVNQAHEYALISSSNYEAFLSASDPSKYYSTLESGNYYIYDITSNKFAGRASSRLEFVDTPTSTFALTVTSSGYTIAQGGDSNSYLFYSPGRIDLWLNGDGINKVAYWKFSKVSDKTYKIYTVESYDRGLETITSDVSEGDLRSSKTYSPRPSFFIVSGTTGDTVNEAMSHALGVSKQAYLNTGSTEIPAIEFPANSTGIYLSPYDIRSLKVKSQKSGETSWTTNSSWTYKGTYTYCGVTYYYIGNQGIGAGNFKFKFES